MTDKKTNKNGIFLITGGLLLIAAALSLLCYNLWDEQRAGEAAETVAEALIKELPEEPETAEAADIQMPEEPAYIQNPYMEPPVKMIDGRDYMGILTIPSLNLTLPVLADCTDELLKEAPCCYYGSPYLNDMVIAGHNYRKHFSLLKLLGGGELIYFTDLDGNEFVYEVAATDILGAEASEEMVNSEWDLSLFTCTSDRVHRLTVRCQLVAE